MKYGDTLRQRSIAEWAPYNIDYDEIKRLIKLHTTPGGGTAVSIPGSGATAEKNFEAELYSALEQEHQRINLFVKTKTGEVERKLIHLSRKVNALDARQSPPEAGSRIAVRRLERYGQIEDEVLQAGKEVQSLSQFINTQRTAFRKLLKKYQKWVKSSKLGDDFTRNVINRPDSLWAVRIRPIFDYYRDVLQAVRVSFDRSSRPSKATSHSLPSWKKTSVDDTDEGLTTHTIAKLQGAAEHGRGVDFDDALSTVPLGANGGTAVYWVHPESVIELQILLLRHTRLLSPHGGTHHSSGTSTPLGTPRDRKPSVSLDDATDFDKEDHIGWLILDTLDRYVKQESGKTIEDREGRRGWPPSPAQGDVRWTANGEALATVALNTGETTSEAKNISARLKRKHLAGFLNIEAPFVRRPSSSMLSDDDLRLSNQISDEAVEDVRKWLSQHPEIAPLVRITSNRTRYVGLTNTSSRGIWLALDRDIHFKKNIDADFCNPDWIKNSRMDANTFPHAVLELRYEGFIAPTFIEELDKSHLVERVRGFSIETHSVWQCYEPRSMPPPFWLPILDKDIRKVPAAERRRSRKGRSVALSTDSNTPDKSSVSSVTDANQTSASSPIGTSDTAQSSPAEQLAVATPSTFKKKRRPRHGTRGLSPRSPIYESAESGYWNEYDRPEDEDEQNGYYIYANPDDSMMPDVFVKAYQKVKILFTPQKTIDEESALLIDSPVSPRDEPSDSSDEDEPNSTAMLGPYANGYGTLPRSHKTSSKSYLTSLFGFFSFPPTSSTSPRSINAYATTQQQYHAAALHQQKLSFALLCFFAATLIATMLHVLVQTGKNKYRHEVDIWLLVGIVANLGLAGTGAGGVLSMERFRRGRWLVGLMGVVVIGVVLADGWLVAWMFA